MSKRILLVSFDDGLLIKQRVLLEGQGYKVTPALRFKEAAVRCKKGTFDLFILSRSIPHATKEDLVEVFRAHHKAPILSLWEPGEQVLDAVNYLEFSNEPDDFVRDVATILAAAEQKNSSIEPDVLSRRRLRQRA